MSKKDKIFCALVLVIIVVAGLVLTDYAWTKQDAVYQRQIADYQQTLSEQ